LCDAAVNDSDFLGGALGQIKTASRHEGATIIDPYFYGFAIFRVRYLYY
jgi:hypothetical protein